MNVLVAAVVLLALSNPTLSQEEEEGEKYMYNEKEFLDSVPSQPHFVMFFAPWCGHCKAMKEEWNKLAEYYNEQQEPRVVTVVKVDCPEYKELCISAEVKGFPTLQLFLPESTSIRYGGERTFEDMKNFVDEKLEEYLEDKALLVDGKEGEEKKQEEKKQEEEKEKEEEKEEEEEEKIEEEKEEENKQEKPVEEEPVTDGLYDFNGMHFYPKTARGEAFVLFYEEGCEICEKVKETWKEIAKIYEDNENVKIGQVDCMHSEASQPCEWERIQGFPIVKYYHEYTPIDSRSITPDIKALKSYIDEKLKTPPVDIDEGGVVKITDETIKDIIGHGVTFAKLYHPNCGFCIRMARVWKELGNVDFSDARAPVTIAELDCGAYETTCKENGGRGFPTLLAYMDGEILSKYDGPRNLEDMKQFVYEMANGYRPTSEAPPELVANEGLHYLNDIEIFRATMKGDSFILYIRKGFDCENVTETWKEVSKFYENDENLTIGLVDCQGSQKACKLLAVRGYPTVKYYRDGNEIEGFSITEDAEGLISHIKKKLKEPVATGDKDEAKITKMTEKSIKNVLSKGVTFVKYYLPGCGFCKRMENAWEKLGKMDFSEASGPVTIAEMNCEKDIDVCREYGSLSFPSLVLFIDGQLTARYGSLSPRTPENMHRFVLDMANGYQHKDYRRDEL